MTLQQKMMTKVMTMMTKKWSLFCRRINTAWVPWRRWSRSWRCWLRNRDVKGVYSYLSWLFCRFGRVVKLHQLQKSSRHFDDHRCGVSVIVFPCFRRCSEVIKVLWLFLLFVCFFSTSMATSLQLIAACGRGCPPPPQKKKLPRVWTCSFRNLFTLCRDICHDSGTRIFKTITTHFVLGTRGASCLWF